jgi:hypothetical protein
MMQAKGIMNIRNREVILKVAEYIAIAATVAGIVISAIANQLLYATIPIAVWLLLGFINRQRLEKRVIRFNRAVVELQQQIEIILPIIAQLPGWENILSKLPQLLNTLPSHDQIQQFQATLEALKAQLNTSVEQQQETFAVQIAQLQQEIEQLQRQDSIIVASPELNQMQQHLAAMEQVDFAAMQSQLESLASQVSAEATRSQFQALQQRLEQVEMCLGLAPESKRKPPQLPPVAGLNRMAAEDFEDFFNPPSEPRDEEDTVSSFLDMLASEEDEEDEDLLAAELKAEESLDATPPPGAFPQSK